MSNQVKELLTLLRPNALSLGSGGMNGMYLLGCLRYLHELGALNRITHYYGTSIGSVLILFIAAGYTPTEMIKIATEFNTALFLNNDLESISLNRSIANPSAYRTFLEQALIKKGFATSITFGDVFVQRGLRISINAYCLTTHAEVVFTTDTHPDVSLLRVVMMSSAVPYLFPPVELDGNIYVDGGLSTRILNKTASLDHRILCIGIDIALDESMSPMDPIHYIKISQSLITSREPNVMLIGPDSVSIDGLNLALSKEQRMHMVERGYDVCKEKLVTILKNIVHHNTREWLRNDMKRVSYLV